MGKTKSFYVSDENAEFVSDHPNASDLVNRLLTQYRSGGLPEDVVKQVELRQARQELESLEAQLDTQREYVSELESRVSTAAEKRNREIDDLIDDMVSHEMSISPTAGRVERIATEHFDGDTEACVEAIQERTADREDVNREVVR